MHPLWQSCEVISAAGTATKHRAELGKVPLPHGEAIPAPRVPTCRNYPTLWDAGVQHHPPGQRWQGSASAF